VVTNIGLRLCVTVQQRKIIARFLSFYKITLDCDLNIMKFGQALLDVTFSSLSPPRDIFNDFQSCGEFVTTGTSTTLTTCVEVYHVQRLIGHLEVGLINGNIFIITGLK